MGYQFMQEQKDEYRIREKGMSFRGVSQRVLSMGEAGGVDEAEQAGRRVSGPHSGDCGQAPLSVWEPAGAGRTVKQIQETGQPEKSGPVDGGKRP
jgi:hypothetical protein